MPENTQEKKIPATGPKISLMKLKRDSGIDNNGSVKATEGVMGKEVSLPVITDQAEEESIKIRLSTDLTQIPEKEEMIAILSSMETLPTEQEMQNPEESLSILSDEKTSDPEPIQQETVEPKEFFPNFHISDKMDLDADLLDLQDFVTIKEHGEATTVEQEDIIIAEHEEIIPVMETVSPEEIPEDHPSVAQIEETGADMEVAGISLMEPIAEIIPEAILSEESSDNTTVSPTPEYVAEVKTELSEQRRAGFRFFVQKKTKIMAGVSLVVLSISAVALFSGSFLPTDIQKSGKSNIQETIKNGAVEPIEANGGTDVENTGASAVTPAESVTTAPTSPVETTSYEMGRDYSVAKNTKKNTRTKTSSGATSGTGAPTP